MNKVLLNCPRAANESRELRKPRHGYSVNGQYVFLQKVLKRIYLCTIIICTQDKLSDIWSDDMTCFLQRFDKKHLDYINFATLCIQCQLWGSFSKFKKLRCGSLCGYFSDLKLRFYVVTSPTTLALDWKNWLVVLIKLRNWKRKSWSIVAFPLLFLDTNLLFGVRWLCAHTFSLLDDDLVEYADNQSRHIWFHFAYCSQFFSHKL